MSEAASLAETSIVLNSIASGLDKILNPVEQRYAFVVLIAEFKPEVSDEKGMVNYVSNAERDDIKQLLKDMVDQWESHQEAPDVEAAPAT